MSPLLSCLLRRHPHLLCTSPLLPCLPRPQFMLLPSPSLPCLPHTPRLPRPSLRLSTFRARCTRCTCRAQARRARRSSARRARRLLHPSLAHLSHLCPMHTPHAPRPEPAARIADTRCRTRRPPRAQVQRARRARPLSLRTHRVCCTSAVFIATRDLRACRAHRSCRALWRLSRWTPRTRCCTWRPLRPKPYVLVAIDPLTMCPAPCTPSPSLLQSRRPSRPKFHACCARRALTPAPAVLRTRSRARRPSRPKFHACCARRTLTPAPAVLRTRSRERRPLRPKFHACCARRTLTPAPAVLRTRSCARRPLRRILQSAGRSFRAHSTRVFRSRDAHRPRRFSASGARPGPYRTRSQSSPRWSRTRAQPSCCAPRTRWRPPRCNVQQRSRRAPSSAYWSLSPHSPCPPLSPLLPRTPDRRAAHPSCTLSLSRCPAHPTYYAPVAPVPHWPVQ
jgi:hypothetical protein